MHYAVEHLIKDTPVLLGRFAMSQICIYPATRAPL